MQTTDEFNSKARSFVTKAKEAGKSNTAIANTIKFMYGIHLNEQQEQSTDSSDWKLMDVDGDGIAEWVNTETQEVNSTGYDTTGDLEALNDDGSGSSFSSIDTQPAAIQTKTNETNETNVTSVDDQPSFSSTKNSSNVNDQPQAKYTVSRGVDRLKEIAPGLGDFFTRLNTPVSSIFSQATNKPKTGSW